MVSDAFIGRVTEVATEVPAERDILGDIPEQGGVQSLEVNTVPGTDLVTQPAPRASVLVKPGEVAALPPIDDHIEGVLWADTGACAASCAQLALDDPFNC
jgi:hypothetical protein